MKAEAGGIPVGRWHSKVAVNVFFCVPPLLVAHEHVALPVDATDATHESWVVVPASIPMQLHPLHRGGEQKRMSKKGGR